MHPAAHRHDGHLGGPVVVVPEHERADGFTVDRRASEQGLDHVRSMAVPLASLTDR